MFNSPRDQRLIISYLDDLIVNKSFFSNNSSIRWLICSSVVPSNLLPPSGRGGVNIFPTIVGEPFSPSCERSTFSKSLTAQIIGSYLAALIMFGIGEYSISLISFSTVNKQGISD